MGLVFTFVLSSAMMVGGVGGAVSLPGDLKAVAVAVALLGGGLFLGLLIAAGLMRDRLASATATPPVHMVPKDESAVAASRQSEEERATSRPARPRARGRRAVAGV